MQERRLAAPKSTLAPNFMSLLLRLAARVQVTPWDGAFEGMRGVEIMSDQKWGKASKQAPRQYECHDVYVLSMA